MITKEEYIEALEKSDIPHSKDKIKTEENCLVDEFFFHPLEGLDKLTKNLDSEKYDSMDIIKISERKLELRIRWE